MKQLPGWTTQINETSNGVYKGTLIDSAGRKAEVTGVVPDEIINQALSMAFDIEKQISANWNKFLYNLCISELCELTITDREYNDKAFGNWFIECGDKRVVYNGKDYYLISQLRQNNDWFDVMLLSKSELTYPTYIKVIKSLI